MNLVPVFNIKYCIPYLLSLLLLVSMSAISQTTVPALPVPKLLGVCTKDSLMKEPYNQWFDKNYNDYRPNPEIMEQLKKLSLKDYSVKLFFGSWCGDSKREVPRMYKILDMLQLREGAISLIGVDDEDSVYKQSPTGEEKEMEIYRVPTCIVYKKGKEIARINEFPVTSLERDFLTILSGGVYTPNYYSYIHIRNWLKNGLLADTNVSHKGLANQIRNLVMNRSELTAAGYVMLDRNQLREGLTIFKIAVFLFPEDAGARRALAEGYFRNGEKDNAVIEIEKALELNKDPSQIKAILEHRDKIKK